MQISGVNYCDFCFLPIPVNGSCPRCGLTHSTYKHEVGLLPPGTNLNGKYIIGRVLGRGGFGATYIAFSSALGKAVAVKEYLPMNISYRGREEETVSVVSSDKVDLFMRGKARFVEEAKTIRKFRTKDDIVSVYEQFDANNTAYFSMEYLEGVDLRKYIENKGGKLSDTEVVKVMIAVCNVLVWVHSTLLMHRDIAPDNIFVCKDGKIKLIDFGAARQAVREGDLGYSVVLKHGFAPPEQYMSNGNQGPWTDIYAVGATMYYALTGKMPPNAPGRIKDATLDFDGYAEKDPRLMAIISKCMAPEVQNRYQNALEVIDALNDFPPMFIESEGPEPEPPRPTPPKPVPPKPVPPKPKITFDLKRLAYILPIAACLIISVILIGMGINSGDNIGFESNASTSINDTSNFDIFNKLRENNETNQPSIDISEVTEPAAEKKFSEYELVVSDASWQNANIEAQNVAGNLVSINSAEEFDKICKLAEDAGLVAFWAGAYIEPYANQTWETAKWTDGTPFDYQKWYENEPTYVDSNGELEGYLLVFKVKDVWWFNDAAEDVSGVYKGKLGYIIEKEATYSLPSKVKLSQQSNYADTNPIYDTFEYDNGDFSYRINYPKHFIRAQGVSVENIFCSYDKSVVLKTFGKRNSVLLTANELYQEFLAMYPGDVTYDVVGDGWLVISTFNNNQYHYMYYKVNDYIIGFEFHFAGEHNLELYSQYIDDIYDSFEINE